ncbi:hypothetical protein BVX99_01010 [bacterium F16]|nr:hypothetical protein BVX99_01010 [bacterium F16]
MKPILWEFRKLRIATLIATVIAAAYVLFNPTILYWHNDYIWLFCSLHVGLITYLASSNQSPEALFLYSRGISRNRIWSAKVLATALSIAVTWGLALILMVAGVRQAVQDAFLTPEAMLMPSEEGMFIWHMVVTYCFFLGIYQYAWTRGKLNKAGMIASCGIGLAGTLTFYSFRIATPIPFGVWAALIPIIFSAIVLVRSCTMHKHNEIS